MRSTDRSLHGRVAFPVNDLPPENPAVVTRILVSACLTGQPVRYNGDSRLLTHPLLSRWQAEGRLVRVCPELDVGFPVPRPPAVNGDPVVPTSSMSSTGSQLETPDSASVIEPPIPSSCGWKYR